MSHQT